MMSREIYHTLASTYASAIHTFGEHLENMETRQHFFPQSFQKHLNITNRCMPRSSLGGSWVAT